MCLPHRGAWSIARRRGVFPVPAAPGHNGGTGPQWWHAAASLVAAVVVLWPVAGPGPRPAVAQPSADAEASLQDITARFTAGDYAGVVTATEGVDKSPRPRPRDPDFVPRMRVIAELLVRRSLAERRLGRLDAAEASVEAAGKVIGDREVQRAVALFVRSAGPQAVAAVVPLELTNLEVLDARIALLLDRLEAEASAAAAVDSGAAAAARTPRSPKDRRQSCEELLVQSRQLREGLSDRLDKAAEGLRASPTARVLASEARPLLQAGRAAIVTLRAGNGPHAPAAREAARAGGDDVETPEAVTSLEKALAAADQAIKAAVAAAGKPERPRAAATGAVVRADYLEWLARARLASGDPAAARADVRAAIAERLAGGQEDHPELVDAFLLGGEVALAEARAATAAGDMKASGSAFDQSVEWLSRARDVVEGSPAVFGLESPLRRRAEELITGARAARADSDSALIVIDAVDAAAGRALRALGRRPALSTPRTPPTDASSAPR